LGGGRTDLALINIPQGPKEEKKKKRESPEVGQNSRRKHTAFVEGAGELAGDPCGLPPLTKHLWENYDAHFLKKLWQQKDF